MIYDRANNNWQEIMKNKRNTLYSVYKYCIKNYCEQKKEKKE